ncbi:lipopolysaccharide biosynthesis protein [Francisella frigiditurris]|nr:oligosaccharide flippase family protein [Francisella frigiditurris]
MIKRILNNHILSKSLLTMFVQALGQGCAFITAIFLARSISMTDYGYYIFGITLATILAVIATMGAGGILARTWGRSDKQGFERDQETFETHNWYFKRGFTIIIITMALAILYGYFEDNFNYIELYALAFAIPFFMANILQSFFVAKRLVVFANLIQLGLRILMLISISIFLVLSLQNVTSLVASMFILMFFYIFIIWSKQIVKFNFKSLKPIGSNMSFALMQWGLLLLSQVDILILKGISSAQDIAIFGVALQLSALVAFVLNAVNSNVLSHIADDYKNCPREEFQKRVTSYTKIIFFLSLIAIVGLLIFGYPITLLYGAKYIPSYYVFCILMIGQLINILSGCVATILNMAGFEKNTCVAFYIALTINVILGIILTNFYGIYGLAVASSISMAYWNMHLLIEVMLKIKVNPTIIKGLNRFIK